jgi:rRNA-processing protein FCF1
MDMKFIAEPNLPDRQVKLLVIDGRISCENEIALVNRGIQLIKTGRFKGVYEAISYHPDIILHHIGNEKIVFAPGTDPEFLLKLKSYGFKLIEGSTVLTSKYPGDIAYNVARVGNKAFHNLKFTDAKLRYELLEIGIELIHVNQGYTKCSVAVVNSNCIITSDKGIAEIANANGIEVLLMEHHEDILLPGLSNGFFGGSTGFIDKNTLCITGNIEKLKSADKIITFLNNHNIKILPLSNDQVVDVGSIIPLMTL